jgi:hypothetical protein
LKSSQGEEYYKLIELFAYWQGSINSTHLKRYFNISRQQAQKYLSGYRHNFPLNLYYDVHTKNYKPTNDFRCHYINDDVNQYLDWASNNLNVLNTNSFESLSEHPISKG